MSRDVADLLTGIAETNRNLCRTLVEDPGFTTELAEATRGIVECLRGGGTLYTLGNGGSAAAAAHFSAEMMGRFLRDRRGYRCLNLSADGALLTALTNDYPPVEVFARQLRTLGRCGDVVVCFTTSGRSGNVLEALRAAQAVGLESIAFCGSHVADLRGLARLLPVPSFETPRIQEIHALLIHLVCTFVEDALA